MYPLLSRLHLSFLGMLLVVRVTDVRERMKCTYSAIYIGKGKELIHSEQVSNLRSS